MSEETAKAAAAFRAYCTLGPERSLAKLAEVLGKPSGYTRHLELWSSQHSWVERAKQYDADQAKAEEDALTQALADEKAKILQSRYALMHKRIEALDSLAQQLLDMTKEPIRIWLPNERGGMTFNDALFRELRGCFADIAAELGERVKQVKQEHSGKIDITGAKDALYQKIAAFKQSSDEQTEP